MHWVFHSKKLGNENPPSRQYLFIKFNLFSLSLGVGLGLTVNLEPPHLLHQARHIVQKLLLARIVHLKETVYMNFKASIF